MSEMDYKKQILKKRDGVYVDWFGSPSTEKAYLAQFDQPQESAEEPETVEISGVPGESALVNAGIITFDDLTNALNTLTDIDGIGEKTAESIRQFIEGRE